MTDKTKLGVIHLNSRVEELSGIAIDHLAVRSSVTEDDEIRGVKKFQDGLCRVTRIDGNGIIFGTGISPSGETVTHPIGELIAWDLVKRFPVTCNGFMRVPDFDKDESRLVKKFMAAVLHYWFRPKGKNPTDSE